MRSSLFVLFIIFAGALALSDLEMESGIRQAQHMYNRKVDFLFGNCAGATKSNQVCVDALNDLVSSVFCANNFQGWCTTSDPTFNTCLFNAATVQDLLDSYWLFATQTFGNVTHHFLLNENYFINEQSWSNWLLSRPQTGEYSAYFQQFAKTGPAFPGLPNNLYILVIGFYNTFWTYDPSTEHFCMQKFLTYNQNFIQLPGLVDGTNAPQLLF